MTEGDDIEGRVRRLENEQARVRDEVAQARADAAAARVLAAGADRDVSEVRAELRAHTGALNALRATQREMDQRMTDGFATLHTGMQHITVLLERVIGPDPA
jgi:chromosome segregation ATPase